MFSHIAPSTRTLKDFLDSIDGDIVLYGAGAFGHELFHVLCAHQRKPVIFLDKFATEGIDIIHPEKFNNKEASIIISIVLQQEERKVIINYLQQLGFNKIIDGQVLRAHYINFEQGYNLKQVNVQKPLEFLHDDESKQIYKNNVLAHLQRNYHKAFESSSHEQYFTKFKHNTRFSSFVDGGAYTGDTFLAAQKQNITINNYYAFEPIEKNFLRLQQTLSAYPKINNKLFQAGLAEKSGMATFTTGPYMSAMDLQGKDKFCVMTLDEALGINTTVDFIKMDIEGAELKALRGAKQIIQKYRPNLAICVYHYINHFWDIPNYIHDLNLGYTLYLRAHSSACMENVLYALQEG